MAILKLAISNMLITGWTTDTMVVTCEIFFKAPDS